MLPEERVSIHSLSACLRIVTGNNLPVRVLLFFNVFFSIIGSDPQETLSLLPGTQASLRTGGARILPEKPECGEETAAPGAEALKRYKSNPKIHQVHVRYEK